MPVIRRGQAAKPPKKPPSVDVLMQRRNAREVRKVEAYTVNRTPDGSGPGEVVDIPENETPLSDVLARARYEGRPIRPGHLLHVSDLIGKCIRRLALVERYEMTVSGQQLSLTDSLTFKQGDAIHDVIKERSARGGPRSIWGNWKCQCGTYQTEAPMLFEEVQQDELVCGACGGGRTEYVEVPMADEELGIVGTPDLIQYLHLYDCFYVDELKSIAHDKWKELTRPLPEHVIQTLFYWFLMNRKGYRLGNRCSILYVTKGWMFSGLPYKEFSFDATEMLKRLDPYIEDAAAFKASLDGGEFPLRVCATPDAPVAKKCDACQVCFKGSHAAPKKVSASSALTRTRR